MLSLAGNLLTRKSLIREFPAKHHEFEQAIGIKSLAFSPDSQHIVSLTLLSAYLWNLEGELVCEPFESTNSSMSSLHFSVDGKFIIGINGDFSHGINKVRLWNLKGNLVDQVYIREVDWVESLAFSSNSKQIVCGGYRGKMRVWDSDGNPLTQLFQEHEYRVMSVAFSPDGNLIASGDQLGTIYLRKSNWQPWLKICCNRLTYNFISENPEFDIIKEICPSCFEYAWSKTDLAQIILRQAGDLSRQNKIEMAAIKLNQALEILIASCREVKSTNSAVSKGGRFSVISSTKKEEIQDVIKIFLKVTSFGNPDLYSQRQKWFEAFTSTNNLFTTEELKSLFAIELLTHESDSKTWRTRIFNFFGLKD
ncbi:MAG: hypothetical protein MUD14_15585 [Hydrococcus sp. Prado102]|nr:hypothetical protein [Hydrococcus sp. Prado102]